MHRRLEARLLPRLENSHILYARVLEETARSQARWLDLGCGHDLVPDWLPTRPATLLGRAIGIDTDLTALREHRGLRHKVCGDAHHLPFRDAAFTLITANMVVEHITDPTALFRELSRLLKPGGRLLIHTPNAFGYTTRLARLVPERLKSWSAHLVQQREEKDVYPAYYRANSEETLRAIAAASGLQVRSCDHVLTSPQLFKIPVLRTLELLWLQRLLQPEYIRQRPVLIAVLVKPA